MLIAEQLSFLRVKVTCDDLVSFTSVFHSFSQFSTVKILKCYNSLCVQRRHNCPPAASCTNCVIKLYLLKAHLQTILSIPVTQKFQILICDTLASNERYISLINFFCTFCPYVTYSVYVLYFFCSLVLLLSLCPST